MAKSPDKTRIPKRSKASSRRPSAAILVFTALSIFAIVSDTFGQNQTKKNQVDEERFAVVSNDRQVVMVDKKSGRSWILNSDGVEKKWVPLERIDSVEAAKKWLDQEAREANGKGNAQGTGPASEKQKLTAEAFADWALEVVLRLEYGTEKSKITRWAKPPKISVFGANQTQKEVVVDVVKMLNEVLARTRFGKIKILDDEDNDADMLVYFAPFDQLNDIAGKKGFKIPERNEGFFAVKWNQHDTITSATILISSDRLKGDNLKHITLEEITQAMGAANDSEKDADSIFYSGHGGPTSLSKNDQILLEVLYSRLKPGNKKTTVRRAYRNHILKLERIKKNK